MYRLLNVTRQTYQWDFYSVQSFIRRKYTNSILFDLLFLDEKTFKTMDWISDTSKDWRWVDSILEHAFYWWCLDNVLALENTIRNLYVCVSSFSYFPKNHIFRYTAKDKNGYYKLYNGQSFYKCYGRGQVGHKGGRWTFWSDRSFPYIKDISIPITAR